jgi:hypothetical protein
MAVIDRNTSVRAGAAAKAEQRKKIALIVGCAILVLVLAFEIPKTLSRLHSSSSAAAPTTTSLPGQTTTITSTPGGSTGTPTQTRGQQRALKHLKVHDPFSPLVKVPTTVVVPPVGSSTAPAKSGSGGKTSAGNATKSTVDAANAAQTAPQAPIGFTAPGAKPAVVAPAAAIIWVNGKQQTVGLKQLFPLKAPAFKLVAIGRDTMKIRVAGGSFTGGRAMITLPRGRAVTLVNTTTGVRYVIRFATALAALPAQTPATPSDSSAKTTTPTTTK